MEKDLFNSARAIKVDMTPYGFTVTSEVNLGGNSAGCGGSCTSC